MEKIRVYLDYFPAFNKRIKCWWQSFASPSAPYEEKMLGKVGCVGRKFGRNLFVDIKYWSSFLSNMIKEEKVVNG